MTAVTPGRIAVFTTVMGIALAGCGSDADTDTPAAKPGRPAVYERIAKMRDCTKLQEQFDLAEQTSKRAGGVADASWNEIGLSYMEAADERMRDVGCY